MCVIVIASFRKTFCFITLPCCHVKSKAGKLPPSGSCLPALFYSKIVFKFFSFAFSSLLPVHHTESELHLNRDLLPPLYHVQEQLRPPDAARLISEMDCRDPARDRL